MRLLKIQYTKKGQLLSRGIRVPVDDDITLDEIREEVLNQILDDLGLSEYSWELSEGDL